MTHRQTFSRALLVRALGSLVLGGLAAGCGIPSETGDPLAANDDGDVTATSSAVLNGATFQNITLYAYDTPDQRTASASDTHGFTFITSLAGGVAGTVSIVNQSDKSLSLGAIEAAASCSGNPSTTSFGRKTIEAGKTLSLVTASCQAGKKMISLATTFYTPTSAAADGNYKSSITGKLAVLRVANNTPPSGTPLKNGKTTTFFVPGARLDVKWTKNNEAWAHVQTTVGDLPSIRVMAISRCKDSAGHVSDQGTSQSVTLPGNGVDASAYLTCSSGKTLVAAIGQVSY